MNEFDKTVISHLTSMLKIKMTDMSDEERLEVFDELLSGKQNTFTVGMYENFLINGREYIVGGSIDERNHLCPVRGSGGISVKFTCIDRVSKEACRHCKIDYPETFNGCDKEYKLCQE